MAITAQLEEGEGSAGTPRSPRRRLRLETSGATSAGATSVLIHNMSLTGLLLESPVALATGERITVELPEAGVTGASVVWSSGAVFGCQFDAPISAAALSAAELRSAVGEETGQAAGHTLASEESFGVRLQRLRKSRGLTLSQVAAEMGVSKPTVWAWEQGKARPVEGRLEALSAALGISAGELRSGSDSSSARDLLVRSRERIAAAHGTTPDRVRIMIEL